MIGCVCHNDAQGNVKITHVKQLNPDEFCQCGVVFMGGNSTISFPQDSSKQVRHYETGQESASRTAKELQERQYGFYKVSSSKEELAREYAIATQENLNKHLGLEVIPAWGPVASAFLAGFSEGRKLGYQDAVELLRKEKGNDFDCLYYEDFDNNGWADWLEEQWKAGV